MTDLKGRFDFVAGSSFAGVAAALGIPMPAPDAPKYFEFHLRKRRVTDANGFFVRRKGKDGIHRWATEGYYEAWLHIGAFGLNLNVNGYAPDTLRTLEDALAWADEFADQYGLPKMWVPPKTRVPKTTAKILQFPIAAARKEGGA
jgi:hypothetical protein